MFFGHTDSVGGDGANKELSDLRAEAMRAAFASDVDAMLAVARSDDWGPAQGQAMLRALGYVAGAIDGEIGPMSRAAIEGFVFEHGKGEHPDSPPPTAGPELDTPTLEALVAAYTKEYGMQIAAQSLLPPQTAGCGSFNPVSDESASCRRVTLTVLEDALDHPDAGELPCTAGDPNACLVDQTENPRCRFYRTFVAPGQDDAALVFFDFRWTRTPTGNVHLSALCNAPDLDEVQFEVGMARDGLSLPPPSSDAGAEPDFEVLAMLSGYVTRHLASPPSRSAWVAHGPTRRLRGDHCIVSCWSATTKR